MKALRPLILLLLAYSSLCTNAQSAHTKNTVYDLAMLAVQPEFQGGQAAMYAWMKNNTVYPDSAFSKGIQGKGYVQFVVEKDAHIDHVI